MIIAFQKNMKAPIMAGTKIHTIRVDSSGRWRAGMKMHMATGVRTKYYNNFKMETVIGIQMIEIRHSKRGGVSVVIDDKLFYHQGLNELFSFQDHYEQMRTLSINDGFESVADFFDFFDHSIEGKILHWTSFKY